MSRESSDDGRHGARREAEVAGCLGDGATGGRGSAVRRRELLGAIGAVAAGGVSAGCQADSSSGFSVRTVPDGLEKLEVSSSPPAPDDELTDVVFESYQSLSVEQLERSFEQLPKSEIRATLEKIVEGVDGLESIDHVTAIPVDPETVPKIISLMGTRTQSDDGTARAAVGPTSLLATVSIGSGVFSIDVDPDSPCQDKKSKLAELKKRKKELESLISELKGKLAKKEKELVEVENTIDEKQADLNARKDALEAWKEDLEAVQGKAGKLAEELEKKRKRLQKEKARKEKELAELEEELGKARRHRKANEGHLSDINEANEFLTDRQQQAGVVGVAGAVVSAGVGFAVEGTALTAEVAGGETLAVTAASESATNTFSTLSGQAARRRLNRYRTKFKSKAGYYEKRAKLLGQRKSKLEQRLTEINNWLDTEPGDPLASEKKRRLAELREKARKIREVYMPPIEEDIAKLEGEVLSLESKLQDINERITRLEKDLAIRQGEIAGIENQIDEICAECPELKGCS